MGELISKARMVEHIKRLLLGSVAFGGYMALIWALVEVGLGLAFMVMLMLAVSYLVGFALRSGKESKDTPNNASR